jgi:8-oxo-dGTP pyrophosphatase MutT (NUDIX family)
MKMRIRSWLILNVKGTNKVVILKRSKKSRNKGQWDFIGGSSNKERLNPRKLIRKECKEEIGFIPIHLTSLLVVVEKFSTYYYYTSEISLEKLEKLRLSHEHCDIKLIKQTNLRFHKKLHHSIKIFLKWH